MPKCKTVQIDEKTHKRLKKQALNVNLTVKKLLELIINREINKIY